jgi:N-methylhydantoinase B
MFISLQRTSQSPIVYEVLDFGVGLTNATGELVSQGNGVAGFLGPLGDAVVATIEEVPNLVAGDVVVANDPYKGGGTHLSDVAMVRPIVVDAEIVAFAAEVATRARGVRARRRSIKRDCNCPTFAHGRAADLTPMWCG